MHIVDKSYNLDLDSRLFLIESNYLELLSDDDPILYSGTSKLGNRIIGVIIEDNYKDKILKYFHLVVENNLYTGFLNGSISLREVFEITEVLYVVDFNYDKTLIGAYSIRVKNIPVEYLPLEDTYCPSYILPSTLTFSSSLQGGKADEHIADPNDANEFFAFTASAIRNSLSSLTNLDYTIEPYYGVLKQGSYKLDFNFVLKEKTFSSNQMSLMDGDNFEATLSHYISAYFDTVFNKLPSNHKETKIEETEEFNNLSEALSIVYQSKYLSITDKTIETLKTSMINLIKQSEEISKKFGKGFNQIEFGVYDDNHLTQPIAMVDSSFFENVSKYIPEVKLDEGEPLTKFSIRVYDLNIETLHCKAYVAYKDKKGVEKLDKVTIKHNLKQLEHSVYSKSLNEGCLITIEGKGQYNKDLRLKIIEVEPTEG